MNCDVEMSKSKPGNFKQRTSALLTGKGREA
jgi:hypothetical protein